MTEREEIVAYIREKMVEVVADGDINKPHLAAMSFAVVRALNAVAHNIENGFYKEADK